MLITKQWARIAGYAAVGLVFVFFLTTLGFSAPYSQLRHALPPEHAGKPSSTASPAASEASNAAKPTSTTLRKAVVMGKLSSDNTDWVAKELHDWESAVYVVDLPGNATSPTGFRTKMNKAREATPYLTYIVEHYDSFPDIAVFVHSHRNGWPKAWHTDARNYDTVNMLQQLRLNTVAERGFVNLRCIENPGCPNEIQLNRKYPDNDRKAELAYPYVYGQFFNMTVERVREEIPVVGTPCCAQFAVTRERVLKRPKQEYARYITLLEESTYDDHTLGGVLEFMWHILFGADPVNCEDHKKCWAEVYGRRRGWSPGPGH